MFVFFSQLEVSKGQTTTAVDGKKKLKIEQQAARNVEGLIILQRGCRKSFYVAPNPGRFPSFMYLLVEPTRVQLGSRKTKE